MTISVLLLIAELRHRRPPRTVTRPCLPLRMRKIFLFVLSVLLGSAEVLSLLAVTQSFARAQTAAYAEITAIDAKTFPQVTALVDVYNASGEFMTGIQPAAVTVYEDSQTRTADTLTESAVPAQIVVGINPGPPLAV